MSISPAVEFGREGSREGEIGKTRRNNGTGHSTKDRIVSEGDIPRSIAKTEDPGPHSEVGLNLAHLHSKRIGLSRNGGSSRKIPSVNIKIQGTKLDLNIGRSGREKEPGSVSWIPVSLKHGVDDQT